MTSRALDRVVHPMGLLILLAVAVAILTFDQVTKALVVGAIPLGGTVPVIGDLLILWHVRNAGAAFSLFQGGTLLWSKLGLGRGPTIYALLKDRTFTRHRDPNS